MCQLNERAQTPCQCLPFQSSEMGNTHIYFTFISPGPWLQHPDLNPVNYKICKEIQQRVYTSKIRKVNGPTLWYGWHGFKQRIINNATEFIRLV